MRKNHLLKNGLSGSSGMSRIYPDGKLRDYSAPINSAKASDCRDRIDLLRSRVNLLTGTDKLLMTMYLENGNSFRQMARLAGVNEVSIARRVHKLIKRLIDGEYITCLRCGKKFTRTEMDIAKDYFLSGLSIRKIAGRRNVTYYGVRRCLRKIQNLITLLPSGIPRRKQ